jgi:hypothetical protein
MKRLSTNSVLIDSQETKQFKLNLILLTQQFLIGFTDIL